MIQNKLTSEIPSGWSIFTLADVAEIVSGVTKGRKLGGRATTWVPYLRVANVQAGYLNLEEIKEIEVPVEEVDKYRLQPGDVVMTEGGDPDKLGRGTVWNGEIDLCLHQNHIFRVRPNVELLDSHYLKAYLGSKSAQKYFLRCAKQTTGIASINKTQLRAFPVPLPPLEEQRRIASILDKADAVRRKRKEAIALTEELLRSAFLEMFGDPVTNPKGWEMVTVGDIVSDVRDGPHVSPEYSDEGIPILSTRNIRPARLIMEDVKYVSKETYLNLVKTFRPQSGDVLLTKGGTTGYAKAVDWDWPFAIWVHIAALRPTEKIRPEFLEAALNSPNCYQQSQRYTHGIANKDLGLTRIRKIKLSLPPLALQDKYCRLQERLLKQLVPQEKSLNESENLFNSLLQRAFRGEL